MLKLINNQLLNESSDDMNGVDVEFNEMEKTVA